MKDVRAWILILAVVCFVAGAVAGRMVTERSLAIGPERGAMAQYEAHLVDRFGLDPERERYLRTLRSAVRPGGAVILATFAADGPERCSGLPVRRHSPAELVEALGDGFELHESRRQEHVTPGGAVQPFTWIAGRLGG